MEEKRHAVAGDFDPLLIGIVGCFAGVLMVAAFHYVANRCTSPGGDLENERQGNRSEIVLSASYSHSALLPSYRHGGPEKPDGTCAVCLSEFEDGEMIRVLPECLHSFHAPCIDMWLYSHSSCPLCRANTRLLPPLPLSSQSSEPRSEAPATRHTPFPRPVTTSMLYYSSEDPFRVSPASATTHAGGRILQGSLLISTSHSDEGSAPTSPAPTGYEGGYPAFQTPIYMSTRDVNGDPLPRFPTWPAPQSSLPVQTSSPSGHPQPRPPTPPAH